MGTLLIRELPVECVIGVHPHERASRQRLLINLSLETDFTTAAAGDRLADALDYTAIAARIEAIAVAGRFQLIETLVERLADALFEDRVIGLELEVWKPAALPSTRHVGVRATRRR